MILVNIFVKGYKNNESNRNNTSESFYTFLSLRTRKFHRLGQSVVPALRRAKLTRQWGFFERP